MYRGKRSAGRLESIADNAGLGTARFAALPAPTARPMPFAIESSERPSHRSPGRAPTALECQGKLPGAAYRQPVTRSTRGNSIPHSLLSRAVVS